MEIAKLFADGNSQAVRLPKAFRFAGDEVYAQKIGDAVLLLPKDKVWETFLDGLNGFSAEYFAEGRTMGTDIADAPRESL